MDNFFMGTKILKEVNSPVNGKIRVVRTLGLGTYLQAEGLTQSGGIVDGFWRRLLGKVKVSEVIFLEDFSCLFDIFAAHKISNDYLGNVFVNLGADSGSFFNFCS